MIDSYGELGSTPFYSYAFLGSGINSLEEGNYEMGYGFYVKNLENGDTVFFENIFDYFGMNCNEPIAWVNAEALESAIKK